MPSNWNNPFPKPPYVGRFPTCGTDAPQIKQSPRPSPGNPVLSCIFFFFSFQSGSVLFGVRSHPTGSLALTGQAFPPDRARHTPLHNQCPVFSGATISGSKLQTQVWDPTRSHLLVSTARTEAHSPAWVTGLTPPSPLCGPHSRILLPPAPRANLSLASWGRPSRPDATLGSSGQDLCSSRLPTDTFLSATSTRLSPTGRRHPWWPHWAQFPLLIGCYLGNHEQRHSPLVHSSSVPSLWGAECFGSLGQISERGVGLSLLSHFHQPNRKGGPRFHLSGDFQAETLIPYKAEGVSKVATSSRGSNFYVHKQLHRKIRREKLNPALEAQHYNLARRCTFAFTGTGYDPHPLHLKCVAILGASLPK